MLTSTSKSMTKPFYRQPLIPVTEMFTRKLPNRYTVVARVRDGHFFKTFNVAGHTAYEAARRFDNTQLDWIRVSGATTK